MKKIISTSNDLKWVAVQLKPNMLNRVIFNLNFQSFDYFAPMKSETIRSGNFFKKIKKLLFPGYIFVRIDPNGLDVKKVDSTFGVSKLVRRGDRKVAYLPDIFIQSILVLQTKHNEIFKSSLSLGKKVRLIEGPFVGMIGEIFKLHADGRLKILFKILDTYKLVTAKNKSIETVW